MTTREETQAKIDRQAAGVMQFAPEQDYSFADRFEERVTEAPDHPFLIWEEQRTSWGEANAQANRFAHYMREQGAVQGDTVAVMIENSPEFLYVWIALAKLGCIAALINTQTRGNALAHALQASESKLLFIGAECLDKLASVEQGPDKLPTFVIARADVATPAPDHAHVLSGPPAGVSTDNPERALRAGTVGQSILCLVFTSGTTGLPKAAKITHMRWLGLGQGWANVLELSSDEVFLCVLPLFHVAAGGSLLSSVFATGGTLALRRRFSASRFWADVRESGATFVQYSGELCRYLLNQPASPSDRDHTLRTMTGSGLNLDTYTRFRERFGVERLVEGYGGTELNVGIANLDNKPGSCGRIPFPERSIVRLVKVDTANDCYVRGEDGFLIDCGVDEPGELLAKILDLPGVAAGRFDGYVDPDATEKKVLRDAFEPGDAYLRSGDLLKRDADDYYYFVDRMGDTYRWKSENVSTSEVANALSGYPGMELLSIYGVRVPGNEGQAGMAAIVMQADVEFDADRFLELARKQLPPYAIPLFVRVTERPDMTETLRLRKVDLRRRGYAPDEAGDALWVLDQRAGAYCQLSDANLSRLGIPAFEPS
ncbi:MAG: long-chain-acyl-CoA synthetase [bacterium]|nr:long-chain-acyl-CoA synthetase [bacterium]